MRILRGRIADDIFFSITIAVFQALKFQIIPSVNWKKENHSCGQAGSGMNDGVISRWAGVCHKMIGRECSRQSGGVGQDRLLICTSKSIRRMSLQEAAFSVSGLEHAANLQAPPGSANTITYTRCQVGSKLWSGNQKSVGTHNSWWLVLHTGKHC